MEKILHILAKCVTVNFRKIILERFQHVSLQMFSITQLPGRYNCLRLGSPDEYPFTCFAYTKSNQFADSLGIDIVTSGSC